MSYRAGSRRGGFTLIELLIVVAIIGIIAAILIPNFLDALQKGRQKRTMGNLREFGNGIAQYWADHSGAAAAGATTVDVSEWIGTSTFEEIRDALVPDYLPQVADKDGWGHDLDFHVAIVNAPHSRYALIRSPAADGVFSGDTYTAGAFAVTDYAQDIVWADGSFVRNPESVGAGS